jgi:hypothetical protein
MFSVQFLSIQQTLLLHFILEDLSILLCTFKIVFFYCILLIKGVRFYGTNRSVDCFGNIIGRLDRGMFSKNILIIPFCEVCISFCRLNISYSKLIIIIKFIRNEIE